jgi:hypothetical protein
MPSKNARSRISRLSTEKHLADRHPGEYSKRFIFCVTYESVQKARVSVYDKHLSLHSGLLGQFISCEETKLL